MVTLSEAGMLDHHLLLAAAPSAGRYVYHVVICHGLGERVL